MLYEGDLRFLDAAARRLIRQGGMRHESADEMAQSNMRVPVCRQEYAAADGHARHRRGGRGKDVGAAGCRTSSSAACSPSSSIANSDHMVICQVDVGDEAAANRHRRAERARGRAMCPWPRTARSLPGGKASRRGKLRGVISQRHALLRPGARCARGPVSALRQRGHFDLCRADIAPGEDVKPDLRPGRRHRGL